MSARRSAASLAPFTGHQDPSTRVRPLLKWAGGKGQLLPEIRRFYPDRFGAYIEPFFGSGAVFFDLHRLGRLENHDVVLIDSNADLMGCYESVRDDPDAINDALSRLAAAHARHGSAHYYHVRDLVFNPVREACRTSDGRITYTPELAAMFIYLNRTGFNGLFRVNAHGGFNVPAGRYLRPSIADPVRLRRAAAALSAPRVRLICGSFDEVKAFARRGDFLYIDPPYAPISRTSSFTAYTQQPFDLPEQRRLQKLVVALARRGCHVLLSNSTAPEIGALYETNREARASGLRALRVPARRAINSNGARRGPVEEFLVTNIGADR